MAEPKIKRSPHLVKYQIKKGEVRNPRGAGAHDPEIKAIKRMTKEDMIDIAQILLKQDFEKLKAIADTLNSTFKGPTGISVFKAMVASVAIKIVKAGDMYALDKLLDRLIGPVERKLELNGKDGQPFTFVIEDAREK